MLKTYLMLMFLPLILFTSVEDLSARSEPIKTFGMGKMNCAALSPDGTTIATAGAREFVYFWDSETGKILDSMTVRSNVLSMAYSPDGTKSQLEVLLGKFYYMTWNQAKKFSIFFIQITGMISNLLPSVLMG